jgi:molybdopterin molybdotransferase
MTSCQEARQFLIAAAPARPDSERVSLIEAVGRVIARPLYALDDLVPFARSAMDGFAVASADTGAAMGTFPVHEPIYAERSTVRYHRLGMLTPIATGAPIPEGADAVIPIEDARPEPNGVRFSGRLLRGENVFPAGEDARAGELLVPEGSIVTPATLGLLAAAGCAFVDVARQPRVALICSGEEIVAIQDEPAFGQVRNSNAMVIAAAVAANGGRVDFNVWVPDDRCAIRDEIAKALTQCDLLVTTGGASVGERDYMKAVLKEVGVTFAFDQVALRPGRPFAFGSSGGTHVAVLPGNPSSAFVNLIQFVLPFVRLMQGRSQPWPTRVRATLDGSLHARPNRTYAPYVALRFRGNALEATPLANQCSSLTRTSAEAAGLAIVPPSLTDYVSGDVIDVDVVDWSRVKVESAANLLTSSIS